MGIHRGDDMNLPGVPSHERHGTAVQHHPRGRSAAIGGVADDRQAAGRQVNPELVGPAGTGDCLNEGRSVARCQGTEPAPGLPARCGDAVAGAADLGDGGVYLPGILRGETPDQSPVDFRDRALLEERR